MHSLARTTKQGHRFPCSPKLSHPQTAQTLAPHATRTRPPPHSPLRGVFGSLAGPCTPSPISPFPAHRPASEAEAAEKPGAGRGRPAAGPGPGDSPSRRGPHSRRGTSPGGCRARRLLRLGAVPPRPTPLGIRRRLPETPPWPRPALQRPARRSSREGGQLTAGVGNWESLC